MWFKGRTAKLLTAGPTDQDQGQWAVADSMINGSLTSLTGKEQSSVLLALSYLEAVNSWSIAIFACFPVVLWYLIQSLVAYRGFVVEVFPSPYCGTRQLDKRR